jgi:branched-chain amino acid aminotransferase
MNHPITTFAHTLTPSPMNFATNILEETCSQARLNALKSPVFGRVFSTHMASMRYTEGRAWHDPKIEPHAAFSLQPSAMALHYAQEIFEGMKVYALKDGGIALFRPTANAARFKHSATRLAMPALPENLFLESVRLLSVTDRQWIPKAPGTSLYLRPFMFASEAALGIKPASEYMYFVIASPAGDYFKGGTRGISLWASETFSRAGPGGTGDAKCGGNYASSLAAQTEALRQGCDQVVFLDALERRWIEELGGMNLFFVFNDGTIRTPPLSGTILPGITRDSLITLARHMGMMVQEEPYSIDQWQKDAESGVLTEAFACGTAAVVTPISHVKRGMSAFNVGNGGMGLVTAQLKKALLNIQYGAEEDPFGWVERLG